VLLAVSGFEGLGSTPPPKLPLSARLLGSGYPNTKKWVKKARCCRVFFLTDFEGFGHLMKHSLEFLVWLLKPFIILGDIQSKGPQNVMLITVDPRHA